MAPSAITVVLTVVDLPAIVFHVTMIVFLTRQIPDRKSPFHQGFYVVYVMVSLVDCVYVLSTYIFTRIPNSGFFTDFYSSHGHLAKVGYDVAGYCCYFQAIGHSIIAFNRWSVFYYPRFHEALWRGRTLWLLIFALILSPFPFIAIQLPTMASYVS
ncbi:hypothetical protein AAVH_20570 [Aphelenchoides avenae]|nr:hypothetical protein AAVH_20570 [Aphelenchus avenae]